MLHSRIGTCKPWEKPAAQFGVKRKLAQSHTPTFPRTTTGHEPPPHPTGMLLRKRQSPPTDPGEGNLVHLRYARLLSMPALAGGFAGPGHTTAPYLPCLSAWLSPALETECSPSPARGERHLPCCSSWGWTECPRSHCLGSHPRTDCPFFFFFFFGFYLNIADICSNSFRCTT